MNNNTHADRQIVQSAGEDLWSRTLERIRTLIPRPAFTSLFIATSVFEFACPDLTIGVATDAIAVRLEGYATLIDRVAGDIAGAELKVRFVAPGHGLGEVHASGESCRTNEHGHRDDRTAAGLVDPMRCQLGHTWADGLVVRHGEARVREALDELEAALGPDLQGPGVKSPAALVTWHVRTQSGAR